MVFFIYSCTFNYTLFKHIYVSNKIIQLNFFHSGDVVKKGFESKLIFKKLLINIGTKIGIQRKDINVCYIFHSVTVFSEINGKAQ